MDNPNGVTAQKMKFFIKDFFSKCDQIRSSLRIWSHLLKKSLMENFIFCAVRYCNVSTISFEQILWFHFVRTLFTSVLISLLKFYINGLELLDTVTV